MEKFLIVCPFLFLSGFVDAIAGGGGLISFPAFVLAGVPVHIIIGTSKLGAFPGAIVAMMRFAKSGFVKLVFTIPSSFALLFISLTNSSILPDVFSARRLVASEADERSIA